VVSLNPGFSNVARNVGSDPWLPRGYHASTTPKTPIPREYNENRAHREVRDKYREIHGQKRKSKHTGVKFDADRDKVKAVFLRAEVFSVDTDREHSEVVNVFKTDEENPWTREAWKAADVEPHHWEDLKGTLVNILVGRTEADISIRAAGVLKRCVYTVESSDASATRLPQAAGYAFSIVPEHAVLIAKLEVDVIRWGGACPEDEWRQVVVKEMESLREREYREVLAGISAQKEESFQRVEREFTRRVHELGQTKVTVFVGGEMVQVRLTTPITCDSILEKVWRDSYFSQNGLLPPVGYEYGIGVRPLKDHQLRNSVSAFNMYAFKAIGDLPEDPRSHNKLLTAGWLRQRDLEYALHGTKKQVQRMVTANGLSLEVVAKPQKACAICRKVRCGPHVRCSTPDGDGCGKKYCSECDASGGLLPPLRTPPRELFTKTWAVTRLSFLCSQDCADAARVELNTSSSPMTQGC